MSPINNRSRTQRLSSEWPVIRSEWRIRGNFRDPSLSAGQAEVTISTLIVGPAQAPQHVVKFCNRRSILDVSWQQSDAPYQILEALIRAKTVKHGIDSEVRHPHGTIIVGSLQPLEGLLFVT